MRDLFGHDDAPPRLMFEANLQPLWEYRGSLYASDAEVAAAKKYGDGAFPVTLWLFKIRIMFDRTRELWINSHEELSHVAWRAVCQCISEHTDPSEQRRAGRKLTPEQIKRYRHAYFHTIMWMMRERSKTAFSTRR